MFAAIFARLAQLLMPGSVPEAKLRIELLRALARNCKPARYSTPVFAAGIAAFDLQWVSPWIAFGWAATAVLSTVPMIAAANRLLEREHDAGEAGRLTLSTLLHLLPVIAIWPAMVLLVWVPDNSANNTYLAIYLCTAMVVGLAMCAPSLEIAMVCVVFYLPVLVTHFAHTAGPLHWLSPAMQLGFGFVMANVAYTIHAALSDAVRQRLDNERMALEVSCARDRAEAANQAKSVFLANMSHDLRTPLNAIIGFSDLMRQQTLGPLSPKKYGEYVQDIHSSGSHLLRLINDILDMAKIEAGKREFDLSEIDILAVAQSAMLFVLPQARQSGVQPRPAIDPDLILVADERALTQILTNLLSNAVKFTKPGGDIVVFARRYGDAAVDIGVEDTGIGMTPEGLHEAVETFGQGDSSVTVEGRGTGLGLPIVKALVELHHAEFHIESEHDVGTRVFGRFPLSQAIGQQAAA